MGGAAVEIARRKAEAVKEEVSGGNFSDNGVYNESPDILPYVSSSAPIAPGDNFSPKTQREKINPSPTEINILKGQDNSQYLPKTTGAAFQFTFQNGRPTFSMSVPNGSYTDIANSFIQAILTNQNPALPVNITTTATVNPPRDSSGDRGGTAASINSPLSNATPNTTTTSIESSKIKF